MRNTLRLISGELKRLVSYKLLARSLATAFIWVIVFLFMSKSDARNIAPLFMFVDTCIVSIMLIGASFFLEQQESTCLGAHFGDDYLRGSVLHSRDHVQLCAIAALCRSRSCRPCFHWIFPFTLQQGTHNHADDAGGVYAHFCCSDNPARI